MADLLDDRRECTARSSASASSSGISYSNSARVAPTRPALDRHVSVRRPPAGCARSGPRRSTVALADRGCPRTPSRTPGRGPGTCARSRRPRPNCSGRGTLCCADGRPPLLRCRRLPRRGRRLPGRARGRAQPDLRDRCRACARRPRRTRARPTSRPSTDDAATSSRPRSRRRRSGSSCPRSTTRPRSTRWPTTRVERDLPGVAGPVDDGRRVRRRAGGRAAARRPPQRVRADLPADRRPPAAARRRDASGRDPDDRDLVLAWLEASCAKRSARPTRPRSTPMTDRWIAGRGRTLHLWEDGEPSRCAGSAARRRTGSGSGRSTRRPAAAAAATPAPSSRRSARRRSTPAGGSASCSPTLANPTSNHIYQEIGYEHVRDVDVCEFDAAMTDEPIQGESRLPDGHRRPRPDDASRSSRRRPRDLARLAAGRCRGRPAPHAPHRRPGSDRSRHAVAAIGPRSPWSS